MREDPDADDKNHKRSHHCHLPLQATLHKNLFTAIMIVLSVIANEPATVKAFTPISLHHTTRSSHNYFPLHAKKKKQPLPDPEEPDTQNDSSSNVPKIKKNSSSSKKQPQNNNSNSNNNNILSLLSNPFQAGKQLRDTLDSVLKSAATMSPNQKAIYYLDDRILEDKNKYDNLSEGALAFAQRNILSDGMNPLDSIDMEEDYIPEVLVIGATGAIGRLVVRRLVLSGRFRVRVLVRDLYSNTLNMLGTGVTYCQGDLRNVESLEYAVTDVDKIVFCAGPPRKDEADFGDKFLDFVKENLARGDDRDDGDGDGLEEEEIDFQKISDTLEIRAKLAQQVDDLGMQNIVRAYQNVRHADYGTSQAAKRSLFKFQDREEDYNLFTINVDEDVVKSKIGVPPQQDNTGAISGTGKKDDYYNDDSGKNDDYYNTNDDYYNDDYSDENAVQSQKPTAAMSSTVKSQVTWMKNKFNHGVFVGKLPLAVNGVGSEASIISSRLRSREDPEKGTDLSNGFAGFVCRMCADGKTYQAFMRTSAYESSGIEYVCTFQTEAKSIMDGNKSLNKFQTVRLPFSNFKPVIRRTVPDAQIDISSVAPFIGRDVKQIGFRVDSADNVLPANDPNKARYKFLKFYIAMCYIKVYRSQPEPEFVYLSDARIPPAVKNKMVRHDLKRIISDSDGEEGEALFSDEEAKRVLQNPKDRSGEELYYKYRGEEILKNSGLQYSIIRVPKLNELPSGEFSTIQLKQSNEDLTAVSRAEVAAVCVSALLDPYARNVCFYLSKAKPGARVMSIDEKISNQFEALIPET